MSFKEVNELRKAGKLDEAYAMAISDLRILKDKHNSVEIELSHEVKITDESGNETTLHSIEDDPEYVWPKRALSWVLIGYLKINSTIDKSDLFLKYLKEFSDLRMFKGEDLLYKNLGFWLVKYAYSICNDENTNLDLLDLYFKQLQEIYYPKPSETHSKILAAFNKKGDVWVNYINFIKWWGLDNFLNEDFKALEISNQKNSVSVVESTYIKIAKKYVAGGSGIYYANPPNKNELRHENGNFKLDDLLRNDKNLFIDKLRSLSNEHPEFLYIPYYIGKLLLSEGEKEEALKEFLPFARLKSQEFWIWDILSEIFAYDKDKHVACLCKAMTLRTLDKMNIKVRQKLAEELVLLKLYSEAKTEIVKILSIREKEGWRIPNNIQNYTSEVWYSEVKALTDNKIFYRENSYKAEILLYSDMIPQLGIVDFVNSEKKILYFIVNKNITGSYKYDGANLKPKCADFLNLYLEKRQGKEAEYYHTFYAEKSVNENSELIKTFKGKPRLLTEKKIGFLEEAFIPKDIFERYELDKMVSKEVTGKAIINYDKSKDRWGWKIIELSFQTE
jgi:hypothetical protein